jgi:hypothetical protein
MSIGYGWGGSPSSTGRSSYSNSYVWTPGIGMPTTGPDINGNHPIRIYSCAIASASGGFTSIYYQGVDTAGGTVFSNSGGVFDFRYHHAGSMSFGGNPSFLSTWDAGDGTRFSSGGMPGSLQYAGVPSAPGISVASVSGRNVTIGVSAPGSDGGSGINRYGVQYSFNGGAWTGEQDGGTTTFANLTPGTYLFRAFAGNDVGLSPAAQTGAVIVSSGGSVRIAGAWRPSIVRVRSGGSWHDATVKVRHGGEWITPA